MAGSKGRSGGSRKGAGRKAAPKPALAATSDDPVEFLREVMQDPGADPRLRVRAAIAAAQYVRSKKGEQGKKEGLNQAARVAATGKFAPSVPPKLVVNNKP